VTNGFRLRPQSGYLIILVRNQPRVFADDDKIGVVRNIARCVRRSAREFFTSQHLRDRRIDGFVGACYGNAAVAQQDSRSAHAHAGKADKVSFTIWNCGHYRFVWKLPGACAPQFIESERHTATNTCVMPATPATRNVRSVASRGQGPLAASAEPPHSRKAHAPRRTRSGAMGGY
jgi:hypothetical protein